MAGGGAGQKGLESAQENWTKNEWGANGILKDGGDVVRRRGLLDDVDSRVLDQL